MPPRSSASSGEGRPGRRRWPTPLAIAVFAGLTVAVIAWRGVFLSRDWLFAWILLALLVLSLGDLRRWARGVMLDWLPLMAALLLYDLSEGVRQLVGIRPHVLPQLDADRLLGGASVPTVALQRALYAPGHPHWYDYATFVVYLSHFFVTLLVAVALWRFAHHRFGRFRTLVVALATAGFVTYVLFPAVPPWLAAYHGYLPPVARTVGEMWQHVGLAPASALFETKRTFYNEVAALPSLHAAYPMLLLLFFWGAGTRVRAGLAAYALAMAFTLVYTGEHYVSDIVVGWAYAAATFAAVSAAWRMAQRRAPRPALRPARAG
jgi:membrane-associated phospholipid phosphatase